MVSGFECEEVRARRCHCRCLAWEPGVTIMLLKICGNGGPLCKVLCFFFLCITQGMFFFP